MKKRVIKYLCVLFSAFVIICSVLSAIAYIYDPQNVYRWNENGLRYFSPMYSTASSIRTYDYDLAIIGSSMVQNFDADELAEAMSCKPLKLTIGAITPSETLWIYKCINEQSKANTFIVNIDLHRFTTDSISISSGRFTEYTYNATGISQFKYLLGYETWFRFIPIDLALTVVDSLQINLPESIEESIYTATNINRMCEFDNTNLPGEEKLYQLFSENVQSFNEGNDYFENLENGCKNMQFFLEELDKYLSGNEKLILLLPPYSVLYWAKLTEQQQQILFDMRKQLATFAQTRKNVLLMDFQSENYTTDLNKYMDSSHYGIEIENSILQDIINLNKNCTVAEITKNSEQIRINAELARKQAILKQSASE